MVIFHIKIYFSKNISTSVYFLVHIDLIIKQYNIYKKLSLINVSFVFINLRQIFLIEQ